MPVSVRTQGLRSSPVKASEVRRRAERMLGVLGRDKAELSILLCNDPTIHELNRDYRNQDKPTDVLAFAMNEGEGLGAGSGVLGDVVISMDTARKQARGTITSEVTMLLAHGLLHLMGYDHQTEAEDRRMRAKTDILVAAAVSR